MRDLPRRRPVVAVVVATRRPRASPSVVDSSTVIASPPAGSCAAGRAASSAASGTSSTSGSTPSGREHRAAHVVGHGRQPRLECAARSRRAAAACRPRGPCGSPGTVPSRTRRPTRPRPTRRPAAPAGRRRRSRHPCGRAATRERGCGRTRTSRGVRRTMSSERYRTSGAMRLNNDVATSSQRSPSAIGARPSGSRPSTNAVSSQMCRPSCACTRTRR